MEMFGELLVCVVSPRQNKTHGVSFGLQANRMARGVSHQEERESKAEFHRVGVGRHGASHQKRRIGKQ